MRMSRCPIPVLLIPAIFLALIHLISVPCSAEYLFDTARQFYLGGNELIDIRTADVDLDGISDLVGLARNYEGGAVDGVVVRLGVGDGTFSEPAVTLLSFHSAYHLHVAMVDDDAYPDVISGGNYPDFHFTALLGNGDGTFTEAGQTPTGIYGSLVIGEFTGDGVNDVAVPVLQTVELYTGQGDVLLRWVRSVRSAGRWTGSPAVISTRTVTSTW